MFERIVPLALLFLHAGAFASGAGPVAPQFTCGDVSAPSPTISASDALGILRAAVSLEEYSLCAADTDDSGLISATDSLLTLREAVGQPVTLLCPFCCAHCDCTPQELTIALSDIDTCDGCIPRIPASDTVDSIEISFGADLNDEFQLSAVEECVWEAILPDAIAQKVLYGSGVTDCTGSSQTFGPIDVALRVTRIEEGWNVIVGQYARELGWGDVLTASVVSGSCKAGGSEGSDNELCHLKGLDSEGGYDTHATGGEVTVAVPDQEPVCE